jgi:hypothetical protein
MSQHVFVTTFQGRPVTVVLGHDRPLHAFFCFVERSDDDDGEEFVYCNLDDPKLAGTMGMSKSLKYFEKRLADLGIAVPASMFDQSEKDRLGNVGNRFVRHAADGTFA